MVEFGMLLYSILRGFFDNARSADQLSYKALGRSLTNKVVKNSLYLFALVQ